MNKALSLRQFPSCTIRAHPIRSLIIVVPGSRRLLACVWWVCPHGDEERVAG